MPSGELDRVSQTIKEYPPKGQNCSSEKEGRCRVPPPLLLPRALRSGDTSDFAPFLLLDDFCDDCPKDYPASFLGPGARSACLPNLTLLER
jgi:hypothetical protein